MADANKVHFGLKNVHYALITYTSGVPSWGTPKKVPGAVNVSLTKESAETNFYADDVLYYYVTGNNGFSGSLEMADFPVQMRQDLWNMELSTTGKLLIEDIDAQPAEFALMFEIAGDKSPDRYCLFRCIASRPDITGATKADTTEVQTQTCDLKVLPVIDPTSASKIDGKTYYRTTADTPSGTYASFYSSVSTTLA